MTGSIFYFFVAKLNSAGQFLWVQSVPVGNFLTEQSITVAPDGNIYAGGTFDGNVTLGTNTFDSTLTPSFFAKFSSSGTLLWAKGLSLTYGDVLAAGPDGSLHVTGYFYDTATFGTTNITSSGGIDIFHAKYTSDGNLVWVRKAGGVGNDYGTGVTVGSDGSSVLVGNFYGPASFSGTALPGHPEHYTMNRYLFAAVCVLKYDADGTFVWAKQATTGYDAGSASAVTRDAAGNSYLTGGVWNQHVSGDYTTESNPRIMVWKVSDAGAVSLTASIPVGTTTFWDHTGTGIGSDSAGNLFVTGYFTRSAQFATTSLTSFGDRDLFVARFNSSGQQTWVKQAGLVFKDSSEGLALDGTGNLYVVGSFYDSANFDSINVNGAGDDDVFIAKLPISTSARPAIVSQPTNQSVTAGANASFSVVATGTAPLNYQWQANGTNLSSATNSSMTISNAQPANQGSYRVIVSNAGGSVTSVVATLTVTTSIAITSQPTNQTVAVGANASFSVTAAGTAPLNYQWQFNGTNIANATNSLLLISGAQPTNAGGYRVLVSNIGGTTTSAVATLTVTSAPPVQDAVFEWVRDAGGPSYDQGLGIAADGTNSIYVTGSFRGSGLFGSTLLTNNYNGSPLDGMFLAKYDNSGAVLWAKGIKNNNVSVGLAVALDGSGNVYVTGVFVGTATFGSTNITSGAYYDVFLAKYSTSGNVLWVRQGRGDNYEGDSSVASEANGNVHCVGAFGPSINFGNTGLTNTQESMFHAKYDGAGNLIWLRRVASPVDFSDRLTVAVDSSGNSYVAGTLYYNNGVADVGGILITNAGVSRSAFLMKADPGGNTLWVRVANGGDNSYCDGVAVDEPGNVYITGRLYQSITFGAVTLSTTDSIFVARCDSSGNFGWGRTFGKASGSENVIKVDANGNSYVAGSFFGTNSFGTTSLISIGDYDIFVVKLDASGNIQWVKQAGSTGTDASRSLGLDSAANVYVTGLFSGSANFGTTNIMSSGLEDIFVTRISATSPASSGTPSIFIDGLLATNTAVRHFGAAQISMETILTNGSIFFTLDGSAPSFAGTLYDGPFVLHQSAVIRALAYDASFSISREANPVSIFIEPIYAVIATTAGGGGVSVSPTNSGYTNGALVTLTATPLPGWTFLQWLGDASGTNPSNTLRVTRDLCVQALFGTSLGTTVAGNGSVVVDPVAPLYPYGAVVRLTGLPQTGNFFAAWGNAASSTNNPLLFTVTNANPMVSSAFGALSAGQAALTVLVNGQGRVTANPRGNRFTTDQTVTLTATPDAGQTFLGWSGDASGAGTNLPVLMNQSKAITASFTSGPRFSLGPCLGGSGERGYQFTLTGAIGARYQIDAATVLPDWTPLATLSNAFGTVQLTDALATNQAQRFYRARLAP